MVLKTVLESWKMRHAQQLSLPAWSPYLQEVQYYTNDVEIAITQMIISKIISKNVCAPDCSNPSPIKPCCHLLSSQPTGQSVFLIGARIRNFNGSLTARADWGGRRKAVASFTCCLGQVFTNVGSDQSQAAYYLVKLFLDFIYCRFSKAL